LLLHRGLQYLPSPLVQNTFGSHQTFIFVVTGMNMGGVWT
jgi:hypothetical protein